jgi:hypothetical protein
LSIFLKPFRDTLEERKGERGGRGEKILGAGRERGKTRGTSFQELRDRSLSTVRTCRKTLSYPRTSKILLYLKIILCINKIYYSTQ